MKKLSEYTGPWPEPDEPDPEEIPEEFIDDEGEVDWVGYRRYLTKLKEDLQATMYYNRTEDL